MASNKRRLSEEGIKRLKPHKTRRLEFSDVVVPGLTLRCTTKGVKSFSLLYKLKGEGGVSPLTGKPICGQGHRITLGTWPMMRLKAAREKARGDLEIISEGRDPRPIRRQQIITHHSNTVEAVARRYIEQDAKPAVASWRKIERSLANHVLPTLGSKPISGITREMIHELLDGMADAKKPGAAREALKHMHRLFEFAVDRGIIGANPAHKLRRAELKPNGSARRNLSDEELRAVWAAACAMDYPFGPWIKMLMLTGQRRCEWAQARRADIDFDGRSFEIPAERFKSRRAHVVPLVGPALEIINGLPVLDGDYLFSTRNGKKPIANFGKPKDRLDELAPIAHYTFHDFRSTCKSRLAKLEIRPEVRDAVMGHALKGMDRIYLKHDFLDEKRAALDLYAKHLMEIVS
jgi:integrase